MRVFFTHRSLTVGEEHQREAKSLLDKKYLDLYIISAWEISKKGYAVAFS
jgi:hypothetical protein